MSKTLSDIKGEYVGESDQAVANAFAEAKGDGTVLIFDKVHSYLSARKEVEKDHEFDLVNQFLMSMENYTGIFACSTDLMKSVDKAALRRSNCCECDENHKDQTDSKMIKIK